MQKKWVIFFLVLNLLLINGIILGVLNLHYPLVGHDYILGLPSLLDTAIHYRLNGLSIQWFTPSFGGGVPAYPNPNNMQYSIPAFLSVILPPWDAVMIWIVMYVSIGFLVCYYFLNKSLNMHWTSSLLGAIFFSANGFVISRAAPGHLGYLSFPLLGIFLVALFDPALSIKKSAPLLGLVIAILIYSAGYFILIVFGLSILVTTPLLFIYNPQLLNWKRLIATITLGGIIGLVISLSKLVAGFALMQHFPRLIADNYPVSFLSGLFGFVLQLLGVMSLFPLFALGRLNPDDIPPFMRVFTGTQFGLWEMDVSITPVVFIILLIHSLNFLRNLRGNYANTSRANKIAWILFIFFMWVGIEFTLAKGLIYPAIRNLPILSSLRANVRFASLFIFPLVFLAVMIFNQWAQTWDAPKTLRIFLVINLAALLPLGFYFMFKTDIYWQLFDISVPQKIYTEMIAGKSFEVTSIGDAPGRNPGALLYRTSNLNLYEPIFGPELQDFHPKVIAGSIWEITNGHYNMTNPIGFIYPELNNAQPFDLFRVDEKDKLELFAKHIQPQWRIPLYQHILNWVSGLAFIAVVLHLIFQSLKTKFHKTLS